MRRISLYITILQTSCIIAPESSNFENISEENPATILNNAFPGPFYLEKGAIRSQSDNVAISFYNCPNTIFYPNITFVECMEKCGYFQVAQRDGIFSTFIPKLLPPEKRAEVVLSILELNNFSPLYTKKPGPKRADIEIVKGYKINFIGCLVVRLMMCSDNGVFKPVISLFGKDIWSDEFVAALCGKCQHIAKILGRKIV